MICDPDTKEMIDIQTFRFGEVPFHCLRELNLQTGIVWIARLRTGGLKTLVTKLSIPQLRAKHS